jgi:hypothetical protein
MRLRPLPCFHVRHNISGAAVEPDPVAIFAGNDPETVMFDFMRHSLARGRGLGLGLDDEPPRGVRGRLGAGNVTVSAVPSMTLAPSQACAASIALRYSIAASSSSSDMDLSDWEC